MAAIDPRHETVLFESRVLLMGRFEISSEEEDFEEAGAIVTGNVVVFPCDPVLIQPYTGARFVADSNTTVFHNLGCPYRRYGLGEFGDRATWFSFPPEIARDAVLSFDPSAADREFPFRFTHGASDTPSYLLQKSLALHLQSKGRAEPLWMEEVGLRVLERSLQEVFRTSEAFTPETKFCSSRPLAERARQLLVRTFRANQSLAAIARELNTSVFHLCRVFRRHCGLTIHRYRQLLRLKASLEPVLTSSTDLTELALELGFSSHSHFTSVFRSTFGFPPSHFRRRASLALLKSLDAQLKI